MLSPEGLDLIPDVAKLPMMAENVTSMCKMLA